MKKRSSASRVCVDELTNADDAVFSKINFCTEWVNVEHVLDAKLFRNGFCSTGPDCRPLFMGSFNSTTLFPSEDKRPVDLNSKQWHPIVSASIDVRVDWNVLQKRRHGGEAIEINYKLNHFGSYGAPSRSFGRNIRPNLSDCPALSKCTEVLQWNCIHTDKTGWFDRVGRIFYP